jgi:hypothetical protein
MSVVLLALLPDRYKLTNAVYSGADPRGAADSRQSVQAVPPASRFVLLAGRSIVICAPRYEQVCPVLAVPVVWTVTRGMQTGRLNLSGTDSVATFTAAEKSCGRFWCPFSGRPALFLCCILLVDEEDNSQC